MFGDAIELVLDDLRSTPEQEVLNGLLETGGLSVDQRVAIEHTAVDLVEACRENRHRAGTLDSFLHEFGLSNKEGIALMCLAEALLRVPDDDTADRLIAEKIHSGDWSAHMGRSESVFVNASVWGLMLTGRVIRSEKHTLDRPAEFVRNLVSKLGEGTVRRAVFQAMKIMGGQFVLGRSIKEALKHTTRSHQNGERYSFDMLGEGARTEADAQRYFDSYSQALQAIGEERASGDVTTNDSISVKLSALFSRYDVLHEQAVFEHLYPRILRLCREAARYGIGLSIDAEETERLILSMRIFSRLRLEPELASWNGLGFVLQAYQKGAIRVCDWLNDLGQRVSHRIPVRLVKGAYWDREIKHAQELGLDAYPVFTKKVHTDVSYQACAQRLLQSDWVYPQFATHNAHTVSMILHLSQDYQAFEFQRLHGMGHLLYQELKARYAELNVRVYAPVGNHKDLLPYLVRRLLENGANSSFVNRFLNAKVASADLVRDPVAEACETGLTSNSAIPLPKDLYKNQNPAWINAKGIDIRSASGPMVMRDAIEALRARLPLAEGGPSAIRIVSPADDRCYLGSINESSLSDIHKAMGLVHAEFGDWSSTAVETRAGVFELVAESIEASMADWVALIVLEAGRTVEDAISEVREAVDFCRYYAQQARVHFGADLDLPGPTGERNRLHWQGRGVWFCISPWNFPLALFMGQVVAALVSGNTVLAKPAEQTPLIASKVASLMYECGVPPAAFQLVYGEGARVGKVVLNDARLSGVAFTGSTDTALVINRTLAARSGPIVPFVAETGGLNTMIVDSTALPEQVVDDVITSAFQSAGQRCSALRVLYLQSEVADGIVAMLKGAMAQLCVGNPANLKTDVGPLIDADALNTVQQHISQMKESAKLVARCDTPQDIPQGYFIGPHAFEIGSILELEREVFGPVLHIIRYSHADLPRVIDEINQSGYALTLGVHSRIDAFARAIFHATRAGNTYVNRNIVGAVVGVNPFGGQGLSGTGPKAGGPNYLPRFAIERTWTDNVVAKGGNTDLFNLS
jgi:RHH-type proline utilization regulon transcriptional repressor/proline dehydrogenase/delta 1-pyrroline-5-carboxylate dehydrogenase